MEKEFVSIRCGQCKNVFKAEKPRQGGSTVATCPHCGHQVTIKLNPVKIKMGGQADKQGQSTVPAIGKPIALKGHPNVFIVKENPVVGRLYKITCPTCGFGLVKKISITGIQKWICPKCNSSISYKAIETEVKEKKEDKKKEDKKTSEKSEEPGGKITDSIGRGSRNIGLIEWGSIFHKKRKKLHLGTIVIGRRDDDQPSDIQLDDKYVSRRSATIDVTLEDKKGYFFKFTVNRAANPVLVNGNELAEGQSIYLAYDDVITMGKTNLTFKKSKEK